MARLSSTDEATTSSAATASIAALSAAPTFAASQPPRTKGLKTYSKKRSIKSESSAGTRNISAIASMEVNRDVKMNTRKKRAVLGEKDTNTGLTAHVGRDNSGAKAKRQKLDHDATAAVGGDSSVLPISGASQRTRATSNDLYTVQYVLAVEMRVPTNLPPNTNRQGASATTVSKTPVPHAFIKWQGYDKASDLTWEVVQTDGVRDTTAHRGGIVMQDVSWMPYYKKAWIEKEFFMEEVLAKRRKPQTTKTKKPSKAAANSAIEYLIRWRHYPKVDDLTWEPAGVVMDVFEEGVREYERLRGEAVEEPNEIEEAEETAERNKAEGGEDSGVDDNSEEVEEAENDKGVGDVDQAEKGDTFVDPEDSEEDEEGEEGKEGEIMEDVENVEAIKVVEGGVEGVHIMKFEDGVMRKE